MLYSILELYSTNTHFTQHHFPSQIPISLSIIARYKYPFHSASLPVTNTHFTQLPVTNTHFTSASLPVTSQGDKTRENADLPVIIALYQDDEFGTVRGVGRVHERTVWRSKIILELCSTHLTTILIQLMRYILYDMYAICFGFLLLDHSFKILPD